MKYLRPFSTHSDGDEHRTKRPSGNIHSFYNNKKKRKRRVKELFVSKEMIRVSGWCSYLT